MYETEFQERIANRIIDHPENVGEMTVKITDNERSVIVEMTDMDAAYTADEARELARSIKCNADQRWEFTPTDLIEHIRDCADVVDGEKTVQEVRNK